MQAARSSAPRSPGAPAASTASICSTEIPASWLPHRRDFGRHLPVSSDESFANRLAVRSHAPELPMPSRISCRHRTKAGFRTSGCPQPAIPNSVTRFTTGRAVTEWDFVHSVHSSRIHHSAGALVSTRSQATRALAHALLSTACVDPEFLPEPLTIRFCFAHWMSIRWRGNGRLTEKRS